MAMTDQEQKEVRSYCAFILEKYGFDISPSDPIIPALYIIHKEMQLNNQNNKAIGELIKEASTKISPTVFHFVSPGEAFRFQLGVAVKWIIISIPMLILMWIGVWYRSMIYDLDSARTIVQASDNVGELFKRAKVDEKGHYFIDFTAARKDSVIHFREFEKLNAKTIRVYLGKKSQ
ncbi:MAG: hypothetical protein HOP08_08440 [Cyclobacteriaceae bacterium]|nr:hypothetical protein [Cyclobacteriaceae bacterium]